MPRQSAPDGALRWSIYTEAACLRSENPRGLRELRRVIRCDLQPRGAMEQILVDQIVMAVWETRRLLTLEAALIREHADEARRGEAQRRRDQALDELCLGGPPIFQDDPRPAPAALQRLAALGEPEEMEPARADTLGYRREHTHTGLAWRHRLELGRLQRQVTDSLRLLCLLRLRTPDGGPTPPRAEQLLSDALMDQEIGSGSEVDGV